MRKNMMKAVAVVLMLTLGLAVWAQEGQTGETPVLEFNLSLENMKNLPEIVEPYEEALVARFVVEKKVYDAHPPGIATFLYIGATEVRPFYIHRNDRQDTLELEFHLPRWDDLEEGAPMILTINHGHPASDPKAYDNRGLPVFSFHLINDQR